MATFLLKKIQLLWANGPINELSQTVPVYITAHGHGDHTQILIKTYHMTVCPQSRTTHPDLHNDPVAAQSR